MSFPNLVVDTKRGEDEAAYLAVLDTFSEDNKSDATEDVIDAAVSRNSANNVANRAGACMAENTTPVQAATNEISAGVAASRYIPETAARKVMNRSASEIAVVGIAKNTAPVKDTTYILIEGGAYTNGGLGTARWLADGIASKMSIKAATKTIASGAAAARAVIKAATSKEAVQGAVRRIAAGIEAGKDTVGSAAFRVRDVTKEAAGGVSKAAALTGAATAGVVLPTMSYIAPIVLPAVGFGSGGVVAGSIAAGVQSMIGNVAAGSLFAAMQSAGATGLAVSTKVLLGLAGGTFGGAGAAGVAARFLLF